MNCFSSTGARIDGGFTGRACIVILAEGRNAQGYRYFEAGFLGPDVGLHLRVDQFRQLALVVAHYV